MKSDLSILIVGGGIGGLTAGAALKQRGFDPVIVERKHEWAPVGAGIVLGINAMNVMKNLGLTEALLERSRLLETMDVTDYRGNTLNTMSLHELREKHGPSIAIHRARLHDALLMAHEDTEIRLNKKFDIMDDANGGVNVEFSDGQTERFDVVIGADGIRSAVRDELFPGTPIHYSGYTCWRFVANDLSEITTTREMWGRGKRFGVVPLADGQVYCFTTENAKRQADRFKAIKLDKFREKFSEFGGDVPRILESLGEKDPIIHDDLEQVFLKQWYSGAVALLGDAAHAMTPNMGQGAAMAIEDGWVLAECLAEEEAVQDAFDRYQKRRQPRVNSIQQQSFQIGKVAQWEGALPCLIRNTIMKCVPNKGAMRSLEKLLTQEL
jgi:2-polyprenyl-6-methoxyphenol hydroxylase-like FAD-dependent oxidoreductase